MVRKPTFHFAGGSWVEFMLPIDRCCGPWGIENWLLTCVEIETDAC